jgi:glucose-6-phosphate isomerase/transaldolase/glucose-6-phosphate isomerase
MTTARPAGLSAQRESLGADAPRVRQAIERLAADKFLERCWRKDATLWTQDAQEQEDIRQRLGWLTVADTMRARIGELQAFAREVKAAGFTHALLLGMGGSSLFPEVCRLTFGAMPGAVDVGILDSTDPSAVRAAERRAPLGRTLAVIASKSGTTAEVAALTAYFYDRFKAAGRVPGQHCIAVTDVGTPLETQAARLQFRRTFVLGPGTGQDIGGRFSALSYFGLVPAALLGLELDTLIDRGRQMLSRCGPKAPEQENSALRLGAALAVLAEAGRDKATFLLPASLAAFGAWLEQLIAESTGKAGKGIAPVIGEPLLEPSRYSADRLFVEIQLAGEPDLALERHARSLETLGHPIVRIRLQDRYDLGGEAMKWSLATTVAGGLMGVNPFSEPNVWESKALTKSLLEQVARERRVPARAPLASDGDLAVYGAPSFRAATVAEALAALFRSRREGDYVAVLSFLPRTADTDAALDGLRGGLAAHIGHATLLEIGPRYLHSTGQLYKGGRDAGLFLLLTAEEPDDLPIPGEPYTFGLLKQAQALGDFEAMQQKGRRILRIHLGQQPQQALLKLQRLLESSLGV